MCSPINPGRYDLSPIRVILEQESTPAELAEMLDKLEEKFLSYTLNDEHLGSPSGMESEWYYLRRLKKAIEQIDRNSQKKCNFS